MKCDSCDSTNQVVSTQSGNFCLDHYRAFKRGKSVGQEVKTVYCDNCHERTPAGGTCLRCGNHLDHTGGVIRVG